MDARSPNSAGGINVEDKLLYIHCNVAMTMTDRCILDAQHLSRHFYLNDATMSFYDIEFVNGNANQDVYYNSGGALYVELSDVEMVNCAFTNNAAKYGGGIAMFDASIAMKNPNHKDIPIRNNTVPNNGGFLSAFGSNITIQEHRFIRNRADYGGVFAIYSSSNLTIEGRSDSVIPTTMENNMASISGGAIFSDNSAIELSRCHIVNSTAEYGGVLYLYESQLTLQGGEYPTMPTVWENNIAQVIGGVIYSYKSMIHTASNAGSLVFRSNKALEFEGGVIFAENSTRIDLSRCHFENNTAKSGGGMILYDSSMILRDGSDNKNLSRPIVIQNNMATKNGGFLESYRSDITIHQYHFENNNANYGSVFCVDASNLTLVGSSDVMMPTICKNNGVNGTGGAIYAEYSNIATLSANLLLRNNIAMVGPAVKAC
jgi:predicted outer membrane repeat protein